MVGYGFINVLLSGLSVSKLTSVRRFECVFKETGNAGIT